MILIAVGLGSAILTMHFAIHGAEVQVPSLKGMTVAEARSQTAGLGLNLEVDNRYYSSDVAPGHILTQSPPPGTVVRREWRVRVAESLGPQKVEVPDTVGADERVAALKLRRVGLAVGVTAQLPLRRRRRRHACSRRIRPRMRRASQDPASTCWWPRPPKTRPMDS